MDSHPLRLQHGAHLGALRVPGSRPGDLRPARGLASRAEQEKPKSQAKNGEPA